ncbi:amidase signature domain-containing protein [Mycena floridula]|nr:amidase signature domain-containing protein [Mycena floridula]
MVFWRSKHRQACIEKQEERSRHIRFLSLSHSTALGPVEQKLHAYTIPELVSSCRSGDVTPEEILRVYTKKVLKAQKDTNCIADILVEDALKTSSLVNWEPSSDVDSGPQVRSRPLLGVPVSLKDTIDILGHDTTIGLSRNIGHPANSSSSIVRLLQDAGALIIAKTTVPTALFSIDTESDIFGVTTNPYSSIHGVGASTGGGAALVACGGAKIEIGSDVAGSLRIPAHACGAWSLKGSAGRFPVLGNLSSMMGLEALPTIAGPIATNLTDLEEFYKRVMEMKPWEYDFTCIPLAWRTLNIHAEGRKLKWGIIWEDGVIPPSPACRRALSTVVDALRAQGHECVTFTPPSIPELLEVGYQLIFGDGGNQITSALLPGETLNSALKSTIGLVNMPRFLKKLIAAYYRGQDPVYAALLDTMHPKTIGEERDLIVRRDQFRSQWHDKWTAEGLDFILTVPSPFPALENGTAEKASMMSAGYVFLFTLLDYVAGVFPVTNVDRQLDSLPVDFASSSEGKSLNNIAKLAYTVYNADTMHGLPLGVQIVGCRLEEEKVLEGMKIVQDALEIGGVVFVRCST